MINFVLDENVDVRKHVRWHEIREMIDKKRPMYLDIIEPNGEDIENLRNIFHFHPVNLEDITYRSLSPRNEEYKNYTYMVVHNFVYSRESNNYRNSNVQMFLGEHYLVTVHQNEVDAIGDAVHRVKSIQQKQELACSYIYYTILDCMVDSYFPVITYWSEKVDDLEGYIFDSRSGDDAINRVIELRKGLLSLKRVIMPQKEVIYKVSHSELNFIREDIRYYLKDVFDHITEIYNSVEEQRDLLSNLMDAHFSKTSARLNEVMQKLTIISIIFLPLTFIVGVYGMNFKNMPELEWNYGYFAILGVMIFTVIGLVFYFKKKKWF